MALSLRSKIINQLATELAAISTDTGASFTPRAVYKTMPNDAVLDSSAHHPSIFIWGGNEEKRLTEFVGQVWVETDIHVAFFNKVCDNAQEVGAEMAADIEAVLLGGDPRLIKDVNNNGIEVQLAPYSLLVFVDSTDQYQAGGYSQFIASYGVEIGNPRSGSFK